MLTCSMCNIDSDCVFNNPYKNNVDMKAPEKLYLSKNIYSTYIYQVPDPDDDSSVEYTRTDAFMEKACDAYCKVCGHYAHTVPTHICRHDCRYYSDFKKAMKL